MKRVTVSIICQIVDSDGMPVNMHGETFGRGWREMLERGKKRISVNRFCPKDLADGYRVVRYEGKDDSVVKCRCHKKWRLDGTKKDKR
jgi:hypothetical protein